MRRSIFLVLVGSIVVNAALGIAALVSGDFGDLEQDVLLTSLCVSGAGVIGLACAPAIERRRLGQLPWLGVGAGIAGFAVFVAGIWLGRTSDSPVMNIGSTLLVAGIVIAWGSLVSLARMAPRFRWVVPVAVALVLALGALFISLIWGEWDSEWFGRSLGIVAVLVGAFTLLVPLLHRASKAELARTEAEAGVRFCPRCGQHLALGSEPGVETGCERCGARFTVTFGSAATAGDGH